MRPAPKACAICSATAPQLARSAFTLAVSWSHWARAVSYAGMRRRRM
jgi:DNA-binding transcriptional regulator YdaS (Cro superfamily)